MSGTVDPDYGRLSGAVRLWDAQVGPRLYRVVVPIFTGRRANATLVGSGVLLRVGNFVILVTAAHVAEDHDPTIVGAGGKAIHFPDLHLRSVLLPGERRNDDPVDLGYGIVPLDEIGWLPNEDAVSVERLDLADSDYSDADQFLVVGYPVSRQPDSFEGRDWLLTPFKFITEELDPESYWRAGADRRENLLVTFDKRDVFRDGRRLTAPDLYGVSGGAIWRLTGSGASLNEPLLHSIGTKWQRRAKPPRIMGTRVTLLLQALATEFPQLRSSIPRG